jgi:heme A synthase
MQLTHRIVAYLLFFHVLAISAAVGRRAGEAAVVKRAMKAAAALVVVQLVLGATMVLSGLPPAVRAVHQMVGIAIWLVLFLAAYLARVAAGRNADMGYGISDPGAQQALSAPEKAFR